MGQEPKKPRKTLPQGQVSGKVSTEDESAQPSSSHSKPTGKQVLKDTVKWDEYMDVRQHIC